MRDTQRHSIEATMNYLGPMDETPFVDVYNRGHDRLTLEPHTMKFTDVRALRDELAFEREGFRLVNHETALRPQDFRDPARVESVYLHEMASIAHSDYTRHTLMTQIGFQLDMSSAELAKYSRIEAFQTWRALSPPPQDNTLALCDARTVSTDDRVVSNFKVMEPREAILEFCMYHYNPNHRWCYFADLQYDEVILFRGFSGEARECQNVLHGAFDLPANPLAHTRESIESRAFAFFLK